jgi:hypothetical protein
MFLMKRAEEVSPHTPIGTSDIEPTVPAPTEHANKKTGSFSSLSLCGECNFWVKEEHYARKHPPKQTKRAKQNIEK